MNKIGFHNFRRFQNFEPLEYKGITFLVGRNNAGKSTLVKALLLINNYYKSNNRKEFSFGNKVIEDANIVSFGRAKNSKTKEDYIKFIDQRGNFYTEIVLTGELDQTYANVFSLLIRDLNNYIDFQYKSAEGSFEITRKIIPKISDIELNKNIHLLGEEAKRIKTELKASNFKKSSKEYILLVEEQNLILNKLEQLKTNIEIKDAKIYSIKSEFDDIFEIESMVGMILHSAEVDYEDEYHDIQRGKTPSEYFETNKTFKEDSKIIQESFNGLYNFVKSSSVIYLGANSTKQSALFPIRDRNNALAQSIHDFYQLRISTGEPAYEFVKKWMKDFEVGDSFEIENHAGEAYEVKINSNSTEIHLADKGMGSIQAMLLILRLACIIHKTETFDKNTTVLIEEPELNLHPALQSKLADLFLEINQSYKLNFIIETHSEYVLRRSQVLVSEKEFEISPNENPFSVYYFPKELEQHPYRLEYQEDGSFNRNFGDGFFDEASSSTLELLKLKRQKKS